MAELVGGVGGDVQGRVDPRHTGDDQQVSGADGMGEVLTRGTLGAHEHGKRRATSATTERSNSRSERLSAPSQHVSGLRDWHS